MNPFFYVQITLLALAQLWVNKGRSMLTTLGIVIGVSSVTFVIAALVGLKQFLLTEFQTFGARKMWILHDHPRGADRRRYPWPEIRMKVPELEAIARHCPSISQVTPITGVGGVVVADNETAAGVSATGIWPAWHEIENRQLLQGRPFNSIDEENARQVCLINDKAIAKLRLPHEPINQHLLFNGRRFLIVGVVEDKQDSMFNADFGAGGTEVELFIPFSTAVKMQRPFFFFLVMAQLESPEVADEAQAEVRFTLRRMRHLNGDEPNTFQVIVFDKVIEQFKTVAAVITAVAGAFVSISLLVGGIGIMNIMLVSVSERTREIGLRKAVGATPAAILLQFLLEAVVLSMAGGAVGVLIGELMAFGLTHLPNAKALGQAAVPMWAIALSFAFCAAVGIIFGMWPAVKASRLNPIDALRHE
jgi:putative ABC transport system permease protein